MLKLAHTHGASKCASGEPEASSLCVAIECRMNVAHCIARCSQWQLQSLDMWQIRVLAAAFHVLTSIHVLQTALQHWRLGL